MLEKNVIQIAGVIDVRRRANASGATGKTHEWRVSRRLLEEPIGGL